jgi:non-ribosomal peptide synthetase component F
MDRSQRHGIYGAFALGWFGTLFGYFALIFAFVGVAMAVGEPLQPSADGEAPVPTVLFTVILYAMILAISPIALLIWAPYQAALLRSIAEAPDRPISELEILERRERDTLLVEWSRANRVAPAYGLVHQRCEAQAARTPHATAIVCGDEALSYAQLDRRADCWARHLRRLGVDRETRVAQRVDRSRKPAIGFQTGQGSGCQGASHARSGAVGGHSLGLRSVSSGGPSASRTEPLGMV